MMKSSDLRIKLVCFSIAIVLIPMIILYLIILAFFNSRSLEESRRYAYNNIQNVSQSIDSALTGLNEITLYMLVNNWVYDYLTGDSSNNAYIRVNNSLQFLPFTSKYYHTISILSDNHYTLNSGRYHNIFLTRAEREKADTINGGSFLSIQGDGIYLIRLMRNFNRLSESIGYTKILLNQSALLELFSTPGELPETGYILLCEDGVLLQSGGVPQALPRNSAFRFENLGTQTDSALLEVENKTYIYSSRPVFHGKAVIVSVLDRDKLYRIDSLLIESIAVGLLMSVFFVIILSYYYTRRVFDPLERLGEAMRTIDQKDFEFGFSVKGSNEITTLVDQFNLMCRRLKMLYGEIYKNRLKLKEAELEVLQSRINPHFLCNTLDTIYWMSEMSRTWKISSMVRSLSMLFRSSLENTEGSLVPFQAEQEHVQCYLAIQKVRYQDQITFEFYVQEDLGGIPVLKLLLQPVVENAIVHGVEKSDGGGGRVVINVYREDDDIIYGVFNTGNPVDTGEMDALMAEENTARRGMAIRNINSRIKMYFGGEYGLSFENQRSGGVLATIRQPVKTGQIHVKTADR
ncbi:MAG: histidine kinase [Treponema sp.]|nr:histidine kinase [Treponema sp.]